jgi:general secretion pathway protein K
MRRRQSRLRQCGAALLAAMLTVTLVATFAAAALWQQWRSVEIETAERARVQAAWILTGALDWSRLILREDGRAGGPDHLGEPWAVPLNEARLSSFLAVDKNASDTEREAFLSGQVIDLQSRLNVMNLVGGTSTPAVAAFSRLFAQLGLPSDQVLALKTSLESAMPEKAAPPPPPTAPPTAQANQLSSAQAIPAPVPAPSPTPVPTPTPTNNPASLLMPERLDQLAWLELPRDTLAALAPYVTLLPQATPVNLNTASVEVIHASTPKLDMADAQRLVAARERKPFNTLVEANQQLGGAEVNLFSEPAHSISSQFFEVTGQLRLEQTVVRERSVLQRTGQQVSIVSRDRGVVISPPPATGGRP